MHPYPIQLFQLTKDHNISVQLKSLPAQILYLVLLLHHFIEKKKAHRILLIFPRVW